MNIFLSRSFITLHILIQITCVQTMFARNDCKLKEVEHKIVITVDAHKGIALEDALKTVENLHKTGQYPMNGVEIILRGGEYKVTHGFKLNEMHSGTPDAPLIIKAANGEEAILFGGEYLQKEWFVPVINEDFIKKLTDKEAAKHILVADLKVQGIREFGEISRHGWMLEAPNRIAPVGLVIGGKRMELSRWPNKDEHLVQFQDEMLAHEGLKGMVSFKRIIDKGPRKPQKKDWYDDVNFMEKGGTFSVGFDRMQYWHQPEKVWLDGVLGTTWEWSYNRIASVDMKLNTITLAYGELNGIGGGLQRCSHFYFENIPEEIDRPGEYYIDRENGWLYLYPPVGFKENSIFLSSLADDVFSCINAKYIIFKGLTIDAGRKNGFRIMQSQDITIDSCVVRNVSMGGVFINGLNNRVTNCHIHDVGSYGIQLEGGNKKTLSPGNNVAEYNKIHNVAWDQKSQMAGVFLNRGVGNRARNNEIYDCPHFAVRMHHTSDCIMENNRIYNLPTYHMFDGGAVYVYTGPKEPENRGNIIRNNFLYNVPTNGIYADNYAMGIYIGQNYFYNVSYLDGQWGFGAIMLNTGGQNYLNDNIFVDCKIPVLWGRGGYYNAYKRNPDIQKAWNTAVEKYGHGQVESTMYNKYPTFKEFLGLSSANDYDEFKWPVSYAARNLVYNPIVPLNIDADNPTGFVNKKGRIKVIDNYSPNGDPGFKNLEDINLELRPDSPVFDEIKDFNPGNFKVFLK